MTEYDRDIENLKLLSVFHYVAAGLNGIGVLVSPMYIFIGFAFLSDDFGPQDEEMPEFMGWMFIIIGLGVCLMSLAMVILLIKSGNGLRHQRSYTLIFVMSVILCLSVPLGTILGIFTIIVLNRPSVRKLFGRA